MHGIEKYKRLMAKRWLMLTIITVILVVFGLAIKHFVGTKRQYEAPKKFTTSINVVDDALEHREYWTGVINRKIKEKESEISDLKRQADGFKREAEKLKQEQQQLKQDVAQQNKQMNDKLHEYQTSAIDQMQSAIEDSMKQNTSCPNSGCEILESDAEFKPANFSYSQGANDSQVINQNVVGQQPVQPQEKPKLGFGLHTVELEPSSHDVIPAGSIVKGVLLGGVVVSTGTNAPSSTEPLHIEITEGLDEPARWFFNKKMKCRAIGEGYGEISSERVRTRVRWLSCVDRKTGKTTETAINAIIRDESGINGIRGTVVSRNGALLRNAFFSGMLGGAANAFGQIAGSPSTYNPFTGNVSQTASAVGMFKQAGSQGIGNALELIAKYNIKQAEASSPVLQVSAGRHVDIIFNASAVIGSTKVERNIREKDTGMAGKAVDAAKDFYGMSDIGGGQVAGLPLNNALAQEGVGMAEEFIGSMGR